MTYLRSCLVFKEWPCPRMSPPYLNWLLKTRTCFRSKRLITLKRPWIFCEEEKTYCCCLLYVSRSLRHFAIAVHLFVDYCLWHAALFHLGSPGPWGEEEKPTAGDLCVMTHKCMFLWQHFSKVNTIQGRGNNSTCLLEINRNTPAAATLPVKKPELT